MNPIFRGSLLLFCLTVVAFAQGCTVRPLLATGAIGPDTPGGRSIAAALSSVDVDPVETRYAQQVRNNLIFLLYGGAGQSPDPRYTLKLHVTERMTSAASVQIADEQQPTAEVLALTATYVLSDKATGKKLASGKRDISAPYDVSRQEYAVYRAEIDAENRAARELAEVLRLSIGQALARLPADN